MIYHLRIPAISFLWIETEAPTLVIAWEKVISELEAKNSGIRYRDTVCWEWRETGGEWKPIPAHLDKHRNA